MRRRASDDELKFFDDCFLCLRAFRVGPHLYEGRRVAAWNIMLCDSCRRSNWDGIVLDSHPRLAEHLAREGVAVSRNAKGWLPIPG
jgi:hypothetical protein